MPTDHEHPLHHYHSSGLYLWLAETCRALGDDPGAQEAYERAIFQDHANEEAARRRSAPAGSAQAPLSAPSFGIAEGADVFSAAGRANFLERDYAAARENFLAAIRLSQIAHDRYHRSASEAHLARGRKFATRDELDLAINDFTKALDLHAGNREALRERARAYARKGSYDLARADETRLAIIESGTTTRR